MKSFNEYTRDRYQEDGKQRPLKENKAKRSKQRQQFRTGLHDQDGDWEIFEKFSKKRN